MLAVQPINNAFKHKLKRKSNKKLTYFTLGLVLVSILGFNLFGQEAYGSQEERTVLVQPGDTLWSIAQTNYPDENIQKSIYYIQKANGLESSNLPIGLEIRLPVF